ncbi:hypothetical protein G5S_0253 [Chlamydia pecorum E58]|uniref:Uncharacterized protein n=1 Tax=Chlamydia pecorum (strain ATCC VR-628 / DSM 29919 / E58) TaxID=331635 RepID=A0AA34WHT7_CHLPE|nr:hypothetical protein G5S_0253 [Chlamydia pecorum E58]
MLPLKLLPMRNIFYQGETKTIVFVSPCKLLD